MKKRTKAIVDPKVTQFPSPIVETKLSDKKKIDYIAVRFAEIMGALGLNLKDESLAKTPQRVAHMYVNEIFSGLKKETFPTISFIENRYNAKDKSNMVFVKVQFTSFCEHHFMPMVGYVYVAYIPNKKLIGLSKIPRIVRYFSKRPQVQERLSAQIADCLSQLLETESIAVSIIAEHYCVMARGVEDQESHTITNVLRGEFDSDEQRFNEFFEAINRTED